MSSHPPSPGAAPPEADDDEMPPQVDEESEVEDAAVSRPYLLFYQKKYYEVPAEAVVYDLRRSLVVPSGEDAAQLHESKSHPKWKECGVHTRHIKKLKTMDGGNVRVGFYITFQIDGEDSQDDPVVVRALHKTIAKKFYDEWEKDWSDEKKEKFKELIADEPSDDAQINPLACHWKPVAAPAHVHYIRPKKEKEKEKNESKGIVKKSNKMSAAKKAAVARVDMEEEDCDDDQLSAAQSSTALVQAPNMGHPMGMASAAGSANFFMQTPGMVTISESYLQQLIANQRK